MKKSNHCGGRPDDSHRARAAAIRGKRGPRLSRARSSTGPTHARCPSTPAPVNQGTGDPAHNICVLTGHNC
jgi:hypothetical protein